MAPRRRLARFGSCACCQRAASLASTIPPPPPPVAGSEEENVANECTCDGLASAATNFYEFVNQGWLQDETVVIPAEYARWGSFTVLVDESLKNQIGILKELVGGAASGVDEQKIASVWRASFSRFEAWEGGKGDCAEVLGELGRLDVAMPSSDDGGDDAAIVRLAQYMAHCAKVGIGCPIKFDKEANFQDTQNIVLDLSPSGTSLPSRDYYVDPKFDDQRGWFRDHLSKIVELVGESNLEEDFVNRVVRFETKLAQMSMKPDQSRQYDQYFTVTTLDELLSGVNKMNHLKGKEANYPENKVDDADEDKEVLTASEFQASDEQQAEMAKFFEPMIQAMSLRQVMEENYAKNYPDKSEEDRKQAQHRLMVFDGDYFRRAFVVILRKSNRRDLKAYFQYKIIKSAKEFCTKSLNEEFFDFYARKLGGQREQKTPEKRTVGLINSWVGELMGKIYVSRFFSEEDKNTVHGMVKDVLKIMGTSLKNNDWLTEETKASAMKKLDKFVVKLGFPDKWKNFDALDISADDGLFAMQQKVNTFEYKTEFLDKINSVKDKTKWEMDPQDVNAYFHPLNNEIVFPAAIMQPPFYQRTFEHIDSSMKPFIASDSPEATLMAVNFGGIGAVIAHEITHGYDDQGRKFDSDGNINDWWKEEDTKLFKSKCDLMAEQATKWTFEDEPEDATGDGTETKKEATVHTMNGDLTMGENLADLGGLSLAYQAMQARFGDKLTKDHTIAFFTSFACIWKQKETKAHTIKALATDPHAPPSFRANLVKNIDAFHSAYETKEGDPMYLAPEKRVRMW